MGQQTKYSLPKSRRNFKIISSCLIVRIENKNTLIERWGYDPILQTLQRKYAGPVFEGRLDIGIFLKVVLLWNARDGVDWITLGSIIVAESSIYKFTNRSTKVVKSKYIASVIPNRAVVALFLMSIVIVVSRIIFFFAVDLLKDRPQLNSVDGLSSIAREELLPSGASMENGRPLYVGLTVKKDGMLRFGALKSVKEAVKPINHVDIL